MKILNYTPHEISIYKNDIEVLTFESDGIARVSQFESIEQTLNINGVDVELTKSKLGEIIGLPDEEENVFIIVSTMVRDASDRTDLITTSNYIRTDKGVILGAKNFTR